MQDRVVQYSADRPSLEGSYGLRYSPARLERFDRETLGGLKTVDFAKLDRAGQPD